MAQTAAPAASPYDPMDRSYEQDGYDSGTCRVDQIGPGCRAASVRPTAAGQVLSLRVCPTADARFELRFATEAEVAMTVRDAAGRPVWTWQPERPFADEPHVLASEVGACWSWRTVWRQVDDTGAALHGRFSLEVDFLEVDDGARYTRRFDAAPLG